MSNLPFFKYTLNGNNFILLDELKSSLMTEADKIAFAAYATDMSFGIGSDNLLIIQPAHPQTLREINTYRHYWNTLPSTHGTDFVFRMFEPDGKEALCCANGLLCVAQHLHTYYNLFRAKILSGIPNRVPTTITVGSRPDFSLNFLEFKDIKSDQHNFHLPCDEYSPYRLFSYSPRYIELSISFERHVDSNLLWNISPFTLKGYYVQFGEPHLVFFSIDNSDILHLFDNIFPQKIINNKRIFIDTMESHGKNLVHALGMYINLYFKQSFPQGISVNFVHGNELLHDNRIVYRTFERGIYKETLACGTGALSIAMTSFFLNRLQSSNISVSPFLCTHNNNCNNMHIQRIGDIYTYYGRPVFLFHGLWNQ